MQLTGGAYESRSIIAAAQRCLNLYPEKAPDGTGEPSPIAHLPTPGLVRLSVAPQERIRCLYRATTGDLYGCAGTGIYYIAPDWSWNLIGSITPSSYSDVVPLHTPVSMCDNGTDMIVCDSTVDGFTFNVQTRSGFTRIPAANTDLVDANGTPYVGGWYGSTRVDYLDTFFLCNRPNTPTWFISGSEATTFDSLDFTTHKAFGDNVQAVISMRRNIWVIGKYSTEIWYNSGGGGSGSLSNNTFPFDILPTFHDIGMIAPYSLARVYDQLYWLSQDGAGNGVVINANGFNVQRISTHAIEKEFSTYSNIEDCVTYVYQQQGHVFVVFNFTTADKTWAFDTVTGFWHERAWIDSNGIEHRHRANQAAFAYDTNVVGDWETGDFYKLDLNTFTDTCTFGTTPIKRLRSFPHIIDQQANRRIFFRQLVANMQVGTSANVVPQPQTVIQCGFTGTDGTLLQSYSNTSDLGATFTQLTPTTEGEIYQNKLVGIGGQSWYQASGVPISADYTVQFSVTPSLYNSVPVSGANVAVIGRATDSSHGYLAQVSSNGTQYQLTLSVLNTATTSTLNMGTLTSGGYTIVLSMFGTVISVQAFRTADGNYLSNGGTWAGSQTTAITLNDATYTSAGHVLIGGNW